MNFWRRLVVCGLACNWLSGTASADWPQFRGANGNGVAEGTGYPTAWGPEESIKWKVALPHAGIGSPIVAGDRVFLVSATEDGRKRSLLCFARADGSLLWNQTVECGEEPTHKQNPFGSTTPAASADRVVVWHSSAGLYCYDSSGKELWSRDLGDFKHIWGYGSSPIIHNGKVVLQTGPGARNFLTAIDLNTGKTLWETEEKYSGSKGADDVGSWSTPVVTQIDGKEQIICAMETRVNGYDPNSGQLLWWCNGLDGSRYDAVSSSPLVGEGICFAMADLRGPSLAFRLGGSGDITQSNLLWRVDKRNPNSVGTGILLDGHIYRPNSGPGTIECLDVKTGTSLWEVRAKDHWASFVLADGHIYALSQRGTTMVFKPNPEKFEEVSKNDLGGETNATPAFADGQIFLRTDTHLYCIAK
ncbi:MAG: PQQ-binding-like beta-propeller repeat protein [Planctomycetales bacterium]|nr:PQQ-binding-like beta-propeller repeat protein [Planctomycetales bacterium]